MLYSPVLPFRVPTFSLKTFKSTNLLSRISHWMTVWHASDISPTMQYIFTLKSFSPIYAVQFLNIFCHFTNLIVAKFYDQMPFLVPAGMMMGPSIFIEAPSLGDCQPKLKSDSPAHEMETASCQASNLYFKVSGLIKTQILFNPLVIKILILSFDRFNSLKASVVLM